MKSLLVFGLTLLFTIGSYSQIKQVPRINRTAVVKPIKFSDDQLQKMKPSQLANLTAMSVDRDKLMLIKPTTSYFINAPKLSDKDLVITSLFGRYHTAENKYEIYPRFVHDTRNGFSRQEYMTLKFRPDMGKRYRLLIKLEPGDYSRRKVFIGTLGEYGAVTAWMVNDRYDEVLMDFEATHNGLRISNLIQNDQRNLLKLHEPLVIKSITLEKLE